MVNLDFIENINYVEFRKMTPARGRGGGLNIRAPEALTDFLCWIHSA